VLKRISTIISGKKTVITTTEAFVQAAAGVRTAEEAERYARDAVNLLRTESELAQGLGATPKPLGRPRGSRRFDPYEACLVAIAVDEIGLSRAKVCELVGRSRPITSPDYSWCRDRLANGRAVLNSPRIPDEIQRLRALSTDAKRNRVIVALKALQRS
jgi:hypothetical protein